MGEARRVWILSCVAAIAMVALGACGGVRLEDESGFVVRSELVPTFTPLPPPPPTRTSVPHATATVPYSVPTPDQFQAAGLPVRMQIPAIGVDAAVEHVGLNSASQIDTPNIAGNVAWYEGSALPGQRGNSVFSGHLDTATAPDVFYELRKLIKGDELVVTYSNNDRYVFVVEDKERYYFDQAPMDRILWRVAGRRLNLYTCDGAWDGGNANYEQRLVVYTRLRES